MNTRGSAPVHFKLSEVDPSMSTWGHTAYLWIEPQRPFRIDDHHDLAVFFEPREGTTFKQIEDVIDQLNGLFETVNFNVLGR